MELPFIFLSMSSESKDCHILIVGVGGQGVIRASQILGWAALRDGMNIRAAETHGMAQRGGSVVCYLNIGKKVEGPLFPRGTADIILSFEEVESLRCADFANENNMFLIANTKLIPVGILANRKIPYPATSEVEQSLKKISKNVFFFDAMDIAVKSGNPKTANTVMLAYLLATNKLNIGKETLVNTIKEFVPKKAVEANLKAFDLAYECATEAYACKDKI